MSLFQPVLHDWCNKGCGMCYPVFGMMHIKEPLLLIRKSNPCGGRGFPFPQSEWSFTICVTPYNRKKNVLSASLNKTFPSFLHVTHVYFILIFNFFFKLVDGFSSSPLVLIILHLWWWDLDIQFIFHHWCINRCNCLKDTLIYFSFQPVLHNCCNKGRGMCYHVCGMMHIKEPLLLIKKSSPCGNSGFPLLLSDWSFIICLTPYNRK